MPRALPSIALAAAAVMPVVDAQAMTFDLATSAATLGQPLNLVFPLRLEPGETLEPGCVSAEVTVGERSVPVQDLRLQVERSERPNQLDVRVRSTLAIEEPLLTITLAAGCPTKLRRKFVVFADPPSPRAQTDIVSAPKARTRAAPVPTLIERDATDLPGVKARPNADGAESKASLPRVLSDVQPVQPAAAQGLPANELELGASAGSAPAEKANIAQLRDGAEDTNAAATSAEQGDSAPNGAWGSALALALAGVLAWAGWRVWQRNPRLPQTLPPVDLADVESAPGAVLSTTAHAVLSVSPAQAPAPVAPAAAQPTFDESLQGAFGKSGPMSIDEQIDLEQQADFFVVLGQHDVAIDLLLSSLRRSGGAGPIPYLKLLEIHRQRGEREAYERARMRFNQRFGDLAPEWNESARSGRTLLDYPPLIERLQRAWPTPVQAMAELEAWLACKGNGGERIDLPAYQDALLLYQLARDLNRPPQRVGAAPTEVDVALPLGEDPSEAAPTLPMDAVDLPLDDLGLPYRRTVVIERMAPTKLDLDLSEAWPAPASRSAG